MVKYGTCKPKTVYALNGGVFTRDVWVPNDGKAQNSNVQAIGGTSFNDGFTFIIDAINKAIELGAPYTKATITIILKEFGSSTHHWVEP